MKVLVVGGGAREHALCWKLKKSPQVKELYCAPGNGGISEIADIVPLGVEEISNIADFAEEIGIDLTVVGPELPLALGIVDEFISRGLRIFGPTSLAAELESSKLFAKRFMEKYRIPTAPYVVAKSAEELVKKSKKFKFPFVVKADGLAAGKGVFIVENKRDLERAVDTYFVKKKFGKAGETVIVEEFQEGVETSFTLITDGDTIIPLPTARDYKRLLDGDTGPNTGGMGVYSPSIYVDSAVVDSIIKEIAIPTVLGMKESNRVFRGFLYIGLMITDDGPKVLEYNVRIGDPESQVIMMRFDDDLFEILYEASVGKLDFKRLNLSKSVAVCVVLASEGYPFNPVKGERIVGLEDAKNIDKVEIFHAGTKKTEEGFITSGGRVLSVSAHDTDFKMAALRAYKAADLIDWPSKICRTDIAKDAIERVVE